MSLRKKLKSKYLVSLNTAHIKLRNNHPRISEDLLILFNLLKEELNKPEENDLYKDDGYIDID